MNEGIQKIFDGEPLENFPPDILFFAQLKAFKLGDMELVKKISKFTKSKKSKQEKRDWDKAKEVVGAMIFPEEDVLNWKKIDGGRNQHSKGKKSHMLTEFEMDLPEVNGYKLKAQMNRCDECDKVRNKYLILFDTETNTVFVDYKYRAKWNERSTVSEMFS